MRKYVVTVTWRGFRANAGRCYDVKACTIGEAIEKALHRVKLQTKNEEIEVTGLNAQEHFTDNTG